MNAKSKGGPLERSDPASTPSPSTLPGLRETADRIHSAAIHLLRRVREEDRRSGLTGPRLSVLSVVVHAGPVSMGRLAEAEQVTPPTITGVVRGLERDGLVVRRADPSDGRVTLVEATASGKEILEEARGRRVERLREEMAPLSTSEKMLLHRAAEILERLALPGDHPARRDPPAE